MHGVCGAAAGNERFELTRPWLCGESGGPGEERGVTVTLGAAEDGAAVSVRHGPIGDTNSRALRGEGGAEVLGSPEPVFS